MGSKHVIEATYKRMDGTAGTLRVEADDPYCHIDAYNMADVGLAVFPREPEIIHVRTFTEPRIGEAFVAE